MGFVFSCNGFFVSVLQGVLCLLIFAMIFLCFFSLVFFLAMGIVFFCWREFCVCFLHVFFFVYFCAGRCDFFCKWFCVFFFGQGFCVSSCFWFCVISFLTLGFASCFLGVLFFKGLFFFFKFFSTGSHVCQRVFSSKKKVFFSNFLFIRLFFFQSDCSLFQGSLMFCFVFSKNGSFFERV